MKKTGYAFSGITGNAKQSLVVLSLANKRQKILPMIMSMKRSLCRVFALPNLDDSIPEKVGYSQARIWNACWKENQTGSYIADWSFCVQRRILQLFSLSQWLQDQGWLGTEVFLTRHCTELNKHCSTIRDANSWDSCECMWAGFLPLQTSEQMKSSLKDNCSSSKGLQHL